ncbi:alpha/beta hydrolase [Persicimonas caeni]|nr:alpha/beta hydrolase [Persicimonas caeni]
MRYRFTAILAVCLLWLGACGDDTANPSNNAAADRTVRASTSADYDFTVETITYAQGLSHSGDFSNGDGEPVDLVGDLYLPQGTDGTRPVLLIVHGGGFTGGTRTQPDLIEFAEYFASRGWVALSVDYRLAGDFGTVPQVWYDMVEERETGIRVHLGKAMYPAVRDAKAAARWLQANADTYDISPDHIAVMGGSAGAFIGVAMGVSNPADFRDELTADEDPTLTSTHLDQTGQVAAVLDFWGSADAIDGVAEAFGGDSRWDADDAPALIVHGNSDQIVSVEAGQTLRDQYEASGAPYRYVELDGAGHAAWDRQVDGQNLRELSEAFLWEHMDLTAAE